MVSMTKVVHMQWLVGYANHTDICCQCIHNCHRARFKISKYTKIIINYKSINFIYIVI